MNDKTNGLVVGDVVRVKSPERYIVSFAKRIRDRDALVVWVGPNSHGMFLGRAKVRFLKRNGRGKEFEEILRTEDLVVFQPAKDRGLEPHEEVA